MSFDNAEFGLFKDFPDAVFVMDPAGTILDANRAFAAQFFSNIQEIRGSNIYELLASIQLQPDITANRHERVKEVLRTGKHLIFEDEQDGKIWRHSVYPSTLPDGEINRLLVIVQDITELKNAELQAHKDNLVFRTLLDAIPGAVFILDDHGLLVGCNEYAFDLFGDSRHEIQGNNPLELFHPDDRDHINEKFLNVIESGVDENDEARMFIQGDRQRMTWFSIHARRAIVTNQPYLVVVGIDIDEQKQVEEALTGYKRWLSLAMEAADSGVWDWNVKTDEVLWSDEIWPLFGLEKKKNQPSFKTWASAVHPDDRKMVVNAVKSAAQSKADLNIEYRVLHQDSSIHWIMAIGRPIFDSHGNVIRYCGTAIDISEQKQIEHELHRSRAHLDFALEKCHIGWWELNLEDLTVLRTLEHARIFGYDMLATEWSFDNFIDHVVPEDRERIKSIVTSSIKKKRDHAFECRIVSATGETRWIWTSGTIQFDDSGKATHILGIVQDITDRKEEEEEFEQLQLLFQQSQKMELVGQLAGGIAHDFNNALTAILGNTELLLERVDKSSSLVEHIRNIEQSAARSANLTRQLLAFARREAASPRTIFLNREIENLLPMLRGLIGSNIQFVWQPNSRDLCVHIDPSQLDQIIVNFCINSRDAIAENGTITIDSTAVHIDAIDCAMGHACQMPGDYVRLSVSDTGTGIDPKTLPHIFEPFFTTKDVGKGTGLGLSTVYGVLKQNHGFIDCRTRIGSGTTFDVYLPLHEESKEESDADDKLTLVRNARETILLVEDEPSILKILTGLLSEKGYTTLAAQDARTAISISEQFPDKIDLLVTDIVLPDMNGVRLSDHLETSRPSMKTLFMSGYAQEMITHFNKLAEGVNFIQKPFAIKSFMDMVSQMLHNYRKVEARPYRARSG